MKSVRQKVDELIAFAMKFRGRPPDYIVLSPAYAKELAAGGSFDGIQVIERYHAGFDFLQVGYGDPRAHVIP